MDNSLSAGDILALAKDDGNSMCGNGFWWIIIFFIIAGVFGGGNGFFGNGNNATLASDEFIKRDIFGTNQNVSATSCETQRDVLNTKYDLGTQSLENRFTSQLGVQEIINANNTGFNSINNNLCQNRYDNAMGLAGIQKDMLLGNANIEKTMLLQGKDAQAQLASCCCDMKTALHAEGEATRALLTQNRIADLEYQLNQANTAVANAVQTQNILGAMGKYSVYSIPYTPYSYTPYGVSSIV